MRIALAAGFVFLCFTSQGQVRNGAFNVLLKSLLSHSVNEVSVEQLSKMDEIFLLDAREQQEFDVSHLENAQRVGYETFEMKSLEKVAKDQKIVVYCSVGYRSEKIAEKLRDAGFTNVSNLYGGIFEWVNEGKRVVNSTGVATNSVHVYSKTWSIWLTNGNKVF